MDNPKMQSLSRCNKRTGRNGSAKNPVWCTAYRAEYANLGIFGAVVSKGTAFAPKQCLHQKVAVSIQNPKMQSLSRCNKRTGRYSPENNPVLCTAYRAEYVNLGISHAVKSKGIAFQPKQCLYQKVAVGLENPEIKSLSRCNNRTARYGPAKIPVSCTAYWAEYSNLGILDALEMVPPLHQSNIYTKM